MVSDQKVEVGTEQSPAGLPRVKILCFSVVLQVFVIWDHLKLMSGTLQPMLPLFQGKLDGQQLQEVEGGFV